jgi:uncharacterized membrane protein required for colicin V production
MHLEYLNLFASSSPILAAAATNVAAAATTAAASKPATSIQAPNGFDVFLGIMLVVGLFRGKKRGMSEELLDVVKWLLIVFLGAVFYKPLGDLVAKLAGLARVYSYMICYLVVVITVMIVFSSIKKAVGEKLIGSDIFGSSEYYLGMMAGMLRFFCMTLVILSFIYCRQISIQDIAAQKKQQEKELGSTFFPSFGQIRQMIFYESFSGPFLRDYFSSQLMEPTLYSAPAGEANTPAKQQNKALDDVMGGKK